MSDVELKDGLWRWRRVEKLDLARFAIDNAVEWLVDPKLSVNPFEYNTTKEGRLFLVKSLYELLVRYDIGYGPESFESDEAIQRVRTPGQILLNPKVGTCLDLSLLFCGLCLNCHLIPWIVVLSGHAFVLVSLEFDLHETEHRKREERKWFIAKSDVLDDPTKLIPLLDQERYCAIECTGFARAPNLGADLTEAQGRGPDGRLDFEAAKRIGREHFSNGRRKFLYAIDLAVARFDWKIEPDHLPPPTPVAVSAAPPPPPPPPAAPVSELGVLPYLCDRVSQSESVTYLIEDVISQETSRPLVFFIVGNEDEEHLALIHRLGDYDLPETIDPPADQPAIERIQVDLPSIDQTHFDEALRRNLGKKLRLKGNNRPSWDDITKVVKGHESPIMFHTSYDTSAWEFDVEKGFNRLEALLEAWGNCGDLPPTCAAIVCVQVRYQSSADDNATFKAGIKGIDDKIQGGAFPRIQGKVLEPLKSVSRSHLIDWQGHEKIAEFCGSRLFTREIDELINSAGGPNRLVPMSRVIPSLMDWLKPFVRRS